MPALSEEASSVIVIGAGMAGLGCARKLRDAGLRVTLLEGRQRVGGRIWTDHSLGKALELGAGWIHGADRNPMVDVARSAGARVVFTPEESTVFYDAQGKPVPYDTVEGDYTRLLKLLERASDLGDRDQSCEAALKKLAPDLFSNPVSRYNLASDTEFDYGAPLDKLSAFWMDGDDPYFGHDALLPGGYDAVPKFLARGLDIRLGQKVNSVTLGDPQATVVTNQGTFKADYVVVTVPLGVLKKGTIKFTPELPDAKKGAISRLGMGLVNRCSLVFEKPFWDPKTHFYGIFSPIYPFWVNPMAYGGPKNVLTSFATGNYAFKQDTLTGEQAAADALGVLRLVFGKAVTKPTRVVTTHWGQDPFAFGSYSYAALGSRKQDFAELGATVEDQLFFAGEATEFKHRATVHGAFMSGQRAAGEILAVDHA